MIRQSAYHLLECTILSHFSVESPLLWLRADPEMEYLAEIHFHQPVQMWVRPNFVIHNIFIGRLHVCLYFISGLSILFCGILGGQSLGFHYHSDVVYSCCLVGTIIGHFHFSSQL